MKKNRVAMLLIWAATIFAAVLLFRGLLKLYNIFPEVYCFLDYFSKESNIFILTFIAIIWYAYYTYRIATDEYVPLATFTLFYDHLKDPFFIRPIISNTSKVPIIVYPYIVVTVNGNETDFDEFYKGKYPYTLSRLETFAGRFSIEAILKGTNPQTSIHEMIESFESNKSKREEQLRFKVKLRYTDKSGKNEDSTEERQYFYHFGRKQLVHDVYVSKDDESKSKK